MKKTVYKSTIVVFIALIAFSITSLQAQDDEFNYTGQGRSLLSTSTGLSLSSVSIQDVEDNIFNATFSAESGYFLFNNFVAGAAFRYNYSKFGEESTWSSNFGLFARYYTQPRIFLGAGYLWSRSKDVEGSSGLVGAELGYAWFLNRTIALEPEINYAFGTGDSNVSILSFAIGLGLYLR